MSDSEIRSQVASAVGVVNTYWVDLFNTWVDDDGNPVAWWQPQLLNGDGFYDSASGPLPSCDGDNDTAGNAFFCGNALTGTGFMAWDMQFLRDYSHLGEVVFYMVVALTIDDADLAEMTEVSHALGDYSGDIHGTPEQRDAWFQEGYQGDIESCLRNR